MNIRILEMPNSATLSIQQGYSFARALCDSLAQQADLEKRTSPSELIFPLKTIRLIALLVGPGSAFLGSRSTPPCDVATMRTLSSELERFSMKSERDALA